ncbi:MAG: DUF4124 domain-containing protein [Lysobacteraceae bacterium]|jgi:hypothetical protein|nr:DUF4124 domain-containing protein [Xanthomonadaceae bacterium]MCZ8319123.1 DUF4124 domain-containing protein [Silanimonas sp.]
MIRFHPLVVALALLLAAPVAHAQDPVYTWVDAQGVRHFSQTPPEGVQYEVRGVRDRAVGTNAAASPAGPTPPSQDQQACDRARLSLAQLDSNAPLLIDKDGDGKSEPLTPEDRAAQRQLAEQAIRAYCVAPDARGG